MRLGWHSSGLHSSGLAFVRVGQKEHKRHPHGLGRHFGADCLRTALSLGAMAATINGLRAPMGHELGPARRPPTVD